MIRASWPRISAARRRKRCRLVRLEIADGRARKESDLRQCADFSRRGEGFCEIGRDRMDLQRRKIGAQRARLRLQEVGGDVDRHVSCDIAALEQQANLGRRARAELDQRRLLRQERCDLVTAVAQDAELGARWIIFRQPRDLFEQVGAGGNRRNTLATTASDACLTRPAHRGRRLRRSRHRPSHPESLRRQQQSSSSTRIHERSLQPPRMT